MFRYPVISAFIGSGLNLVFLGSVILLSWFRFFSGAPSSDEDSSSGAVEIEEILGGSVEDHVKAKEAEESSSDKTLEDLKKELLEEEGDKDEDDFEKEFGDADRRSSSSTDGAGPSKIEEISLDELSEEKKHLEEKKKDL